MKKGKNFKYLFFILTAMLIFTGISGYVENTPGFYLEGGKSYLPGETPEIAITGTYINTVDITVLKIVNPEKFFSFIDETRQPAFDRSTFDSHLVEEEKDAVGDEWALMEVEKTESVNIQRRVSDNREDNKIIINPEARDKGMYLVMAEGSNQRAYTWFSISSVGLIVSKSRDSAVIFAADKNTGSAISGADIGIYRNQQAVVSGRTGDDGIFTTNLDLTGDFIITASSDEDFDVINPDYYPDDMPGVKVYITTDRPVYRPGDTLYFQGIIKDYHMDYYSTPDINDVEIELKDAHGTRINDPGFNSTLRVSPAGGFWGVFNIPDSDILGRFSIHANVDGRNYVSFFKVDEYREPRFEIILDTDESRYIKGDTISLEIEAKTYTNLPVPDASGTVTVFKSQYYMPDFHPEEFGWYFQDFERQNITEDQVLERNVTLDEDGKASFEIETDEFAAKNYSYRIVVNIIDPESNERVNESITRLITVNDFAMEIKTDRNLYDINENGVMTVEAKHYDGRPASGVDIDIVFESITFQALRRDDTSYNNNNSNPTPGTRYYSEDSRASSTAPSSSAMPIGVNRTLYQAEEEVLSTLLTESITTDADGIATLNFTATAEGAVRIRAQAEDDYDNPCEAKYRFWIAVGNEVIASPQAEGQIIIEKSKYSRNDTLEGMIILPYQDLDALVTVESSHLYHHETLRFDGTTALFDLNLQDIKAPNIMLRVAYFKDGSYHETFKEVIIPPEEKFLDIEIEMDQDEYEPGSEAEITVRVNDGDGNPVQAEVMLAVVDASIYGVSRDILPEIKEFFYSKRKNNVQGYQSINNRSYGMSSAELAMSKVNEYIRYAASVFSLPFAAVGCGGMAQPAHEYNGNTRDDGSAQNERPVPAETSSSSDYDYYNEGGWDYEIDDLGEAEASEDYYRNNSGRGVPSVSTGEEQGNVNWQGGNQPGGLYGGTRDSFPEDSALGLLSEITGDEAGIVVRENLHAASYSGATQGRSNFVSTAYFEGSRITNADGSTTFTMRFPDNITAWRIKALAYTSDGAIGTGTDRVRTLRRIYVDPSMPRFLTENDQAEISFIVYNTMSTPQQVELEFSATNLRISGDDADDYLTGNQALTVPARRGEHINLTASAVRPGNDTLTFTAKISGTRYQDTISLPYTINPYGSERYIAYTGVVEDGRTELAFNMPSNVKSGSLDTKLRLAGGRLEAVLSALEYMIQYPYGCAEQTMNKFLPTVIAGKALRDLNIVQTSMSARVENYVNAGLQTLYGYQNSDGGWGWWGNNSSNPHMTAYVMFGMALTKDAGYDVDETVMRQGKVRLGRMLEDRSLTSEERSFIYYAYALCGGSNDDFIEDAQDEDNFKTPYSASLLALGLYESSEPREAAEFIEYLKDNIVSDDTPYPVAYWEASSNPSAFHEDSIEVSSLGLKALSKLDPSNDDLDAIVDYLLINRTGERWRSTKDTAIAVLSILDYLSVKGVSENDYDEISITVNDDILNISNADEYALPSGELLIPVSGIIPNSRNILEIGISGNDSVFYSLYGRYFSTEENISASSTDISIERNYYKLTTRQSQSTITYSANRLSDYEGSINDIIMVELIVNTDTAQHFVQIEDPIPAGCEIVEEYRDYQIDGYDIFPGDEHREYFDDKAAFFYQDLDNTTIRIYYLLDVRYAGIFNVMPASAKLMYFPEIGGTTDSARFEFEN